MSQLIRLGEHARPEIAIEVDGVSVAAMAGDTVLTAVLLHRRRLREAEFGDGARAGFCLMGACQDCWVWRVDGTKLRACSSFVEPGMRLVTKPVDPPWPRQE